MHTRNGIAHFDSGGFNRPAEQARAKATADAAAKVEAERKAAYEKTVADILKKYSGEVPLTEAINLAAYIRDANYTPRSGGRDGTPEKWGVSDADAAKTAFSALGVDPALIPKNVDISFYEKLQDIAGGRLDPKAAWAEATTYDDGRKKGKDIHIPELLAVGLYQGKTGADLWKPVEDWNDSQRGARQGWNAVKGFATDAYKGVTSNPLGVAIISAVAAKYGIPPEVTSAAISVDQGADLATVARNYFTSKLGAKLGDLASAEVTGALKNSNLDAKTVANIGKVASGATKGGVSTGTLEGAVRGGATAGTGVIRDMAGTEISDWAARYGLDKIDTNAFDSLPGFNGLPNLKGNLVEGVSANDVQRIVNMVDPKTGKQLATLRDPVGAIKGTVNTNVNRNVNNAVNNVLNSGSSGATTSSGRTTTTGGTTDREGATGLGGVDWGRLTALLAPQQNAPQQEEEDTKKDTKALESSDVFDFLARNAAPQAGTMTVADLLKLTNRV